MGSCGKSCKVLDPNLTLATRHLTFVFFFF